MEALPLLPTSDDYRSPLFAITSESLELLANYYYSKVGLCLSFRVMVYPERKDVETDTHQGELTDSKSFGDPLFWVFCM